MKYVIKVWLFTILISPLLIALIFGVINNNSSFDSVLSSYDLLFVMIVVGLLSSIPSMVYFYLISKYLIKKYSNYRRKIILTFYSFLSVWVTFYIIDNGSIIKWSKSNIWVLTYSLTMIIAVWIFKNKCEEITE